MPARRRENWSGINLLVQVVLLFGVIGLLLLPLGIAYWFKAPLLLYLLFAVLVLAGWSAYFLLLERQGNLLEERRFDIAETLTRKTEKV